MHKVVLRHRHSAIEGDTLDFGNIDRLYRSTRTQSLHKRCDIVGTIAILNILHHNIARNRQCGVEWQYRLCRVTTHTASILQNSQHTSLDRLVGSRWSIYHAIDHKECYDNNECRNKQ